MSRNMTRRQLFGSLAGRGGIRRPPAAVAERQFMDLCDGCGRCIEACAKETGVLRADRGGGPVLDFESGHCVFCAECIRACTRGALDRSMIDAVEEGDFRFPWHMEISAEACMEFSGVTCRLCESACEERAIRFRPMPGHVTRAWIETADCNGCGECLPRCPRGAITIIEKNATASSGKEQAA